MPDWYTGRAMVIRKPSKRVSARTPARPAKKRAPNLIERIAALAEKIPAEELERVPSDSARNLDHYLYGSPKRG